MSYQPVLEKHAFSPSEKNIWISIGNPDRVQGWKLHVSSIPSQAENVLESVLPILRKHRVDFKLAKSRRVLSGLNSGDYGRTQVGKFMTIYPTDDKHALRVARDLRKSTQGYLGPRIPSDLQLGDIVYARYGAISPVTVRNRFGQTASMIYGPNGELRTDEYQVPYRVPTGIACPFKELLPAADDESSSGEVIIGSRYRPVSVLRTSAKGALLLTLDTHVTDSKRYTVLKHAPRHRYTDEHDRDATDRLRKQEQLHAELADLSFLPRADNCFEWRGDTFLPIQYLPGSSIEKLAINWLAERPLVDLQAGRHETLWKILLQLVQHVKTLHDRRIVHRDISANNVWIHRNGQVYLLDLELAHGIEDESPPYLLGTPGFMSPNQENMGRPCLADDIYSVGCVMILALTGTDPQRILFGGVDGLADRLRVHTRLNAKRLFSLIAACVADNESERPDLGALEAQLQRQLEFTKRRPERVNRYSGDFDLRKTLRLAVQGLMSNVAVSTGEGLWLSHSIKNGAEHGRNKKGNFELLPDANRGIAGVVYLMGRLARRDMFPDVAAAPTRRAVNWLLGLNPEGPDELPGLHFGRAGVALALAEVAAAGVVEKTTDLEGWVAKALNARLDWPDVTHGAAGQGIAAIAAGELLGRQDLIDQASRCADYLIANQSPDGTWRLPEGVQGIAGESFTGFAHGTAGIVYFLSEAHRRTSRDDLENAWRLGAQWLIDQSELVSDARIWRYSDSKKDPWRWWCHGSPGIALTFLRLFESTGETQFADVAREALLQHSVETRFHNLSQCHGLAGLGDIYLNAARVLDDRQFHQKAVSIAEALQHLGQTRGGGMSWMTEEIGMPTADLMVGSGGIVHFLLQLASSGQLGFPLLLPNISA